MPGAGGWELSHSTSWLLIRLYLLNTLAVCKMPLARCQHLCRVPMSSNVRAEDKRDKPQRTQLWGGIRCGGGFCLILKFLWDPDSF